MASVPDRLRLKDRIISNISKAIKSVQECSSSTENPVVLSNNSWQCHKLCEHLDHVFLHGLKHIGHGYWKVVTEFTRKNAIKEIKRLQNVTTDLGRGRAWLFMALNESSLESYLRCFEMNEKLVKKYYVKESLVMDQQRMNVLLTLTAGLEYAVFQLDYDVAYLDLNTYPPRSRADSEAAREDEDKVSLCSMDSIMPTKERSASMLSTQGSYSALTDGDNVSVQSADTSSASHDSKTISIDSGCNIDKNDTQDKLDELDTRIARLESAVSVNEECPEEDLGIEVIHVKSKGKKKKSKKKLHSKHTVIKDSMSHKQGDKLEEIMKNLPDGMHLSDRSPGDGMDSPVLGNEAVVQGVSHIQGVPQVTDTQDKYSGDSICRSQTLNSSSKMEKHLKENDGANTQGSRKSPKNVLSDSNSENISRVDENSDVVHSYSKTELAKLYQLSFDEDNCDNEGDVKDDSIYHTPDNGTHKQALGGEKSVMDTSVYHTPNDDLNTRTDDGEDKNCDIYVYTNNNEKEVKPSDLENRKHLEKNVVGFHERHTNTCISEETDITKLTHNEINSNCPSSDVDSVKDKSVTSQLQDRADFLIYQSDSAVNRMLFEEEDDSTVLEEEEHDVGKLLEEPEYNGEIMLDNNTLLNVMLEVFEDSEEQFVKIFGTRMGHTEGEIRTIFVLITDKTIYLLYQDQGEQKFAKDASVLFTDLDYISLSVDEQVIQIVCTNRRKQYWITTGNQLITRAIINCLSSAMEESHHMNGPKLSVLNDATIQKIALKKFVAKECHIDQSEVELCCYSLIHWDDPLARGRSDETFREGHMLYRIQESTSSHFLGSQFLPTTLIYGNTWKPAYIVLREGILCIFNNKQDSKPQYFVQVGGEDCSGCRRSKNSDREHTFEINKTNGSSWQIAAASEHEANDWLQSLCQCAAESTEKHSHRPGCLPCCLVLTPQKLLMCHEDVQTNFFRTLGSANVTEVTGISVDDTEKSFCILEFEAHEVGVSSEQWVLYFSAKYERDRFIKQLSIVWSNYFEVEMHENAIEDFSLQQSCRDMAAHLHSTLEVK